MEEFTFNSNMDQGWGGQASTLGRSQNTKSVGRSHPRVSLTFSLALLAFFPPYFCALPKMPLDRSENDDADSGPDILLLKHDSSILRHPTLYLAQERAKPVLRGPNSTEPNLT